MISSMNSIVSLFLVLSALSWSQIASSEDLPLTGTEKIILVSPQAVINVIPLAAGAQATLRITPSSSQSFSSRSDGTTLKVIGSGTRGATAPKIDIYINDVPIEVHLIEGQVNLTKSNNPVTIELQRGRVVAKDSRSAIQASILSGGLSISNHQNRIQAEIFKGDLTVKGLSGDLNAVLWQGEVFLDKVQGSLNLKQYQGNAKSTEGSGSLVFEIGRANVSFNGFKGRVEGSSQEGTVNLTAGSEPEVHIKSQLGKININGGGTNSFVSIITEDGEIFPPSSLRVAKVKNTKVLKGRLKGSKPGGRIEVVAQAGQVFLKD